MKKAIGINLSVLFIYLAFFFSILLLQSYDQGLANTVLIILNLGLILFLLLFREINFEKNISKKYNTKTILYNILPLFFLGIFYHLFIDPLNNLRFVLGTEAVHSSKLPLPKMSLFFYFYTTIFAPVIEELVFRQYLLKKTIFHTRKITFSIFLTSTAFGLIHLPNLSTCLIAFFFEYILFIDLSEV
ncbi:lysostaphin resistance A-like protein [Maribacter sp. 2307ULW6-5]|uniref:CPBP family intramembrane glutamic endopeptidase n=1 Tax=Maribacter sp. 2307ULW6-5 TaxID=3386275 RepID=UPI0039BC86CD